MNSEHQNGNLTGNGTQTEQALRASELSYRRLFEAAQDGILILDADTGRINDVNPFLIKLLGFSRDEMAGKTVGELSPFKDIVSNQAMLQRLQENGYVRYHDLPLETKDGRKIAVEFVSNVYQAGDKKVIQCNIRDITQFMQAEKASIRLASLVESSDDAIMGKDLNGIITSWNKGAGRIFGYTAGEMVGTSILRLIPADRQDEENQILEKIKRGESVEHFETLRKAKDGRLVNVLVTASPIKDAAGNVTGVSKVAHDITERKRAEEALQKSEKRFRSYFELGLIGMAISSPARGLIEVNDQLCQILGYERSELLQMSWEQLTHPDDLAAEAAVFNRVLAGDCDRYVLDKRYIRKDGQIVNATIWVECLRHADGSADYLLGLLQDITERKRVEAALRDSEAFLNTVIEKIPHMIFVKDAKELRFVKFNQAGQDLLGYSLAELAGKNDYDLFPKDMADHFTENDRKVLRGREVVDIPEEPVQTRDKGERILHTKKIPILDNSGQLVYLLGISEDITERRKLTTQLIEAQKMEVIGRLASGVAHDFNNVIAVIMGYGNLITSGLDSDSPLQKYAGEIQHAADRAAGLTRQLLVFSRKQTVLPVVLDLNETVRDLDKMLRRLIDEHIEMAIVPGKQTGRIKADSGYMGQVLMNLVVNARDAMPNGGKLTIATNNVTLDENYARTHTGAIPGDYVMLSVTDTGTGMTDEVKAHLFEAFFTTKPVGKGTGLGLATCQTIVRQSGGHIGVDSEIGKGTTFKIYFPRVDQPLDSDTEIIKAGPVPRGTETLLVVEDEPAVRHLASGILESLGYNVLRASNGQEALRVVHECNGQPISLVITDVIMPQMGGKVMAEWLKATYPNIKILFTSGHTDDAISHHGILEPGIAFLSKPYASVALARKVRATLDKP